MKLDILVLAAHPDDAELGCSGTLASHIAKGYKAGVVDFTRGELGTRGTPKDREGEANASANILGLSVRENLELEDGFFQNTRVSQLAVVRAIRKFRPEIVLANAISDRHPDHGRAAQLAFDACFLAGLIKVETSNGGESQQPWRPKSIYHFLQSQFIEPDFVVDISEYWDVKMQSIKAFKTQFHNPEISAPETYISKPAFLHMVESRAIELGHSIGVRYGEGFTVARRPGVRSLFDIF